MVDHDLNLAPPPDDFEPSRPSPRRRPRRFFWLLVAGCLVGVGGLTAAAVRQPEFHRERLPVGGPLAGRPPTAATAAAEEDLRRLITGVAAMHAAFVKVGPWDGAFSERQCNAWLAVDLPRNHANILPEGIESPRIQFLPGGLRAGCRVGREPLAATAWVEAEIRLLEPNHVEIRLDDARLGSLPIPRGPILRELGHRLGGLGLVTELRRLGDRLVLEVYIPSTHEGGGTSHWLESLRIEAGAIAVAGETRQGGSGQAPGGGR
ncbi:MAG: hypothetical protein RLZZ440_202 [Planctomycetota bacterium]|jgi:hypothetical protein